MAACAWPPPLSHAVQQWQCQPRLRSGRPPLMIEAVRPCPRTQIKRLGDKFSNLAPALLQRTSGPDQAGPPHSARRGHPNTGIPALLTLADSEVSDALVPASSQGSADVSTRCKLCLLVRLASAWQVACGGVSAATTFSCRRQTRPSRGTTALVTQSDLPALTVCRRILHTVLAVWHAQGADPTSRHHVGGWPVVAPLSQETCKGDR